MKLLEEQNARRTELLADASVTALSTETRIACAFAAVYLPIVWTAEVSKVHHAPASPNEKLFLRSLKKAGCTLEDISLGVTLLHWYLHQSELLPLPCTADSAIAWAKRVIHQTIQ